MCIAAIGPAHLTEAALPLADDLDLVGVKLAGPHDIVVFSAYGFGSNGIVALYIVFVVSAGIAEVKAFEDPLRNAALTGEKAMSYMAAHRKLGGNKIYSALFKAFFHKFRHN